MVHYDKKSVADPGFPRQGVSNPWVWVENIIILEDLCWKVHEN